MLCEAFKQRFGLMPRMFDAAADRAGLVVLQLHAQFFDTGAAGQALAFQQLPGDRQGLLGDGQFVTNPQAFAVELFALLLSALLLLGQISKLAVEVLLAGPQASQFLKRALLFTVVLQQAAKNLHLLGHGLDFAVGFAIEQFQRAALLAQLLVGDAGALLQRWQFTVPVLEAVGDQRQGFQAVAPGVPGLSQRGQLAAALQLFGNPFKALRNLLLLVEQGLQAGLTFSTQLPGVLMQVAGLGQFLGQVIKGVLGIKRLLQQRFGVAVLLLRVQQAGVRLSAAGFQLLLLALQRGVLSLMLTNLLGQRVELDVQGGPAGKAMALRAQTLQLAESLPFAALLVPGLLRTVQRFLRGELFVAQTMQLDQPLLLEFQLPLLCLMGLEVLLRVAEALLQLGQLLRAQRDDVAGLGGEGFQRFFGFLALAVGAPAQLAVDRSVGQLFQQFAALLVVSL